MLNSVDTPPPEDPRRFRFIRAIIVVAALVALALALLGSPSLSQWLSPTGGQADGSALLLTATPTPFQPSPTPTQAGTFAPTATSTLAAPIEVGGATSLNGLKIVSLGEFGYAQLFSYRLTGERYTRLTNGPWDDVHPAMAPDGTRLAFASNRGGQWDLYLLDLQTGETRQLSDDARYDGHPSWSADGSWLTYEHSENGNLEIYIRPLDDSIDPVLISNHPGLDFAPVWRPGAQQIAFISDRGGQPELWLVDLEESDDERFTLLVSQGIGSHSAPAWSPDGEWLAWSAKDGEVWQIYTSAINELPFAPNALVIGTQPHWSPSGDVLLATFQAANQTYMTAYVVDGSLALAADLLPGRFAGASWGATTLPDPLPGALRSAAEAEPAAAWAAALSAEIQVGDEADIAPLDDVSAPFPELSLAAIPAFDALRQRTSQLLGWDALSSLENAFVPINEPMPPARQQDWLLTGRAFSLHSGLLDAGWMVVVPEEFGGQTYWRVYLRSAADDSGLGVPLSEYPWYLSARFGGSQNAFQSGGAFSDEIPAGGWVDFTALAADFGFERLPALSNWRNYYQGALFNEFALTAGLAWEEAMLQLYSKDAVATASAASSP